MKRFLLPILILLSLCSRLPALDDDDIKFYLDMMLMRSFLIAGTSIPPLTFVVIDEDLWAILDRGNPIIIYNRRRYLLVPQGQGQGYGIPLQGAPKSKSEALVDPNATIIRFEVKDI
jgi:hypothetical protein